ncbi:MAG TPA: methyltransferase domain-containing protein [Pyrinomonadaceae bacterium]|nr:methyltransferase domain-containing protein [Pyrinomonadaceae bacterium]
MLSNDWPELRCPKHLITLVANRDSVKEPSVLRCENGCRVPVINGIPRFVDPENYAAGFGLQWNAFANTQLDSHTGLTVSRDRLAGALGDSLEVLRGKSVLEVGCGAGRFTEVMLAAGARVFAFDLSTAVDANYENCHHWPNYFVCQADVRHAPLQPHSFDFVVCLGVIQHTPDPEETIAALASYVRPGGTLVLDHYALEYPSNFAQRNLRRVLIRMPARMAKPTALALARFLLPLHKLTWSERRGVWRIRRLLRRVSPLIDYYEVYPELGKRLLAEWSMLDTHDTLTDHYKHLRTAQQIEDCLRSCGLVDIAAYYGGNGVEARARRPASSVCSDTTATG